jgi:hypothetical protein
VQKSFEEWYQEFLKEIQRLTRHPAPNMDKESFRDSWEDNMTPTERAIQELEDLR